MGITKEHREQIAETAKYMGLYAEMMERHADISADRGRAHATLEDVVKGLAKITGMELSSHPMNHVAALKGSMRCAQRIDVRS